MTRIKRMVAGGLRLPPRRHYYGDLEGVATHVDTRDQRAFLRKAREAIAEGGLLIAGGMPGTGKTHALAMLLAEFPQLVYLAITPETTGAQIMAVLYEIFNDRQETECPPYLTGDPLGVEVEELLLTKCPILVIDDANYMGDKLVEHFIFLQTHGEFPLLMLGHGLDAIVQRNEALRTRRTHGHTFRRLRRDELWATLGEYHPCFAATEREVLEFINERYALGAFRCWASVLHRLLNDFPAALEEGITSDVAKRILRKITGHQNGDQPSQRRAA